MEVRFADEQSVFKSVYNGIVSNLEKLSLDTIKEISRNEEQEQVFVNQKTISEKKENFYFGSGTKFKEYSPYKQIKTNPNQVNMEDGMNFTKTIISSSASF
jgi:DNA mismatch repair ATPase MutL